MAHELSHAYMHVMYMVMCSSLTHPCLLPLQSAEFFENADISRTIAKRQPYKEWLKTSLRPLSALGESAGGAGPARGWSS
jgi:hypothetical protein